MTGGAVVAQLSPSDLACSVFSVISGLSSVGYAVSKVLGVQTMKALGISTVHTPQHSCSFTWLGALVAVSHCLLPLVSLLLAFLLLPTTPLNIRAHPLSFAADDTAAEADEETSFTESEATTAAAAAAATAAEAAAAKEAAAAAATPPINTLRASRNTKCTDTSNKDIKIQLSANKTNKFNSSEALLLHVPTEGREKRQLQYTPEANRQTNTQKTNKQQTNKQTNTPECMQSILNKTTQFTDSPNYFSPRYSDAASNSFSSSSSSSSRSTSSSSSSNTSPGGNISSTGATG